jgi:hypothetical protein
MGVWLSLLVPALLLAAALGLMYWHGRVWQAVQSTELPESDHEFYRRQYRRRMQLSAMLGIVAIILIAGEILSWWIVSQVFSVLYLVAALLLVIWIALLLAADVWATRYHFDQLQHKNLIEQAKLHGEIRRIQATEGNGEAKTEEKAEEE